MAAEPFEYNNVAGRLYQNFKDISKSNGNAVQFGQFTKNLGIPEDWDAILTALMQMRQDFNELQEIVNDTEASNAAKFSLWKDKLNDINTSILSFQCNMLNKSCSMNIIPGAIISLQFIAADLPKEELVSVDDLEQLRKLCDELRSEILAADGLSRDLKNWLLDLVRLMRDSIDRYKIRGNKGLRRQLHEMLGSLLDHEAYAEETKKKAPTIWVRLMGGLESMCKMGKYAEAGDKTIGYVMKAIEQLTG